MRSIIILVVAFILSAVETSDGMAFMLSSEETSDGMALYCDGKSRMDELSLGLTLAKVFTRLDKAGFFSGNADDIARLVFETAIVESDRGKFDSASVNLGAFQIQKRSADDTLKRLTPQQREAVSDWATYGDADPRDLLYNVPYGIAMCAAYYVAHGAEKEDLSTVELRAHFWKRVYNTPSGKGSVRTYVRKALR